MPNFTIIIQQINTFMYFNLHIYSIDENYQNKFQISSLNFLAIIILPFMKSNYVSENKYTKKNKPQHGS